MDWFVACHSLLEGTMTRNGTKVWDLNYLTVIMSATTKPGSLCRVHLVGMAEPCSTRRPQEGLRTGRRRGRVRGKLPRPQDERPGHVARGTGQAPSGDRLRICTRL